MSTTMPPGRRDACGGTLSRVHRSQAGRTVEWAQRTLLLAILAGSGSVLPAQERVVREISLAPSIRTTPVVIVSGATEPEFRQRSDIRRAPTPLTAAQKAEILRTASGPGEPPAGVGQGIRLTPSQPFLSGRGRLDLVAPLTVFTAADGGRAVIPKSSIGPWTPAVSCTFRPTAANQRLLVDLTIATVGKNRLRLYMPGEKFEQILELQSGDQHVTTVVIPTDLTEKTLVLTYVDASFNNYFEFFACDITPTV